jgi:hypothetical protein
MQLEDYFVFLEHDHHPPEIVERFRQSRIGLVL